MKRSKAPKEAQRSERVAKEPDRWLCRKAVEKVLNPKENKEEGRIHCQLVWGHWFYPKENDTRYNGPRIVGKSYHELTGPTAEQSIADYCDDLNARHVPPTEVPNFKPCRAPKWNDPNQMGLVMMIQPKKFQ